MDLAISKGKADEIVSSDAFSPIKLRSGLVRESSTAERRQPIAKQSSAPTIDYQPDSFHVVQEENANVKNSSHPMPFDDRPIIGRH